MRLTTHLVLVIGLGIFAVLGLHAFMRVQYDRDTYRSDVRRDHRVLGRSIATLVEHLWSTDGSERALEAVEHQNEHTSHVVIRWVELGGDASDAPLRPEMFRRARREPVQDVHVVGGANAMVTYVPFRVRGVRGVRAGVELVERLDGEVEAQRRSLVRTATTTGFLLVVSIGITMAFGVIFIARPLRKLVDRAADVGEGRLEGGIELRQNDEIRDLAIAFERMVDRLKTARRKEDEAVAARIDALEQLRHADRLKTIGELASGVAHELGTPLNVVRARGAMIAGGEVPETRMRELGAVVVEQVDRMSVSIRQLLAYARRTPSQRTESPLEPSVQAVARLLSPIAQRKDVSLDFLAGASPRACRIDAAQIEHALTNVVVNALDASPPHGRVSLRVDYRDAHAAIVVKDDGAGIPQSDLARVLEPFFTTKRVGEGTGLGLAIANEILREHGGALRVVSRPSEGTEVTLELPYAQG